MIESLGLYIFQWAIQVLTACVDTQLVSFLLQRSDVHHPVMNFI